MASPTGLDKTNKTDLEDQRPKENKRHRSLKIILFVMATAQLAFCSVALIIPDLIVGNMPKKDAEDFMESLHDDDDDDNESFVPAKIGYFESYINRTLDGSSKEGMVSIFAFSLLSTVSSLITVLYAVQVMCHCCDGCDKKWVNCCDHLAKFLGKLAKANFSSGVSSIAVAGMTGFSLPDLEGGTLGPNFYLQIVAGGFSALIQYLKIRVKKTKGGGNDADDKKNQEDKPLTSTAQELETRSKTPGTVDNAASVASTSRQGSNNGAYNATADDQTDDQVTNRYVAEESNGGHTNDQDAGSFTTSNLRFSVDSLNEPNTAPPSSAQEPRVSQEENSANERDTSQPAHNVNVEVHQSQHESESDVTSTA